MTMLPDAIEEMFIQHLRNSLRDPTDGKELWLNAILHLEFFAAGDCFRSPLWLVVVQPLCRSFSTRSCPKRRRTI